MKIKLLAFICLILSINTLGQTPPTWEWAKRGTSIKEEVGYEMVRDNAGNIYVSGEYSGQTFTIDSITLTNPIWSSTATTNSMAYVAKFNPQGHVLWAIQNGTSQAKGYSMDVASDGTIYLAGYGGNTISFDTVTVTGISPSVSFFLAAFTPSGNCKWIRVAGEGWALQVRADDFGHVIVGGYYVSSTINIGGIILNNTTPPGLGINQLFIASFDSSGNVLWAKSTGGNCTSDLVSIAIDDSANVFISGNYYASPIYIDTFSLANSGKLDTYLFKLNSAGHAQWVRGVGGSLDDTDGYLVCGSNGTVYMAGSFASVAVYFPPFYIARSGTADGYIVKYDSNGNPLWAKKLGGSGLDYATAIAADSAENIYIAGAYESPSINFDNDTLINPGTSNRYIAKCDSAGNFDWAFTTNSPGAIRINHLAASPSEIYLTGGYSGAPAVYFGNDTLIKSGNSDMFIAKLSWATVGVSNIQQIPNNLIISPNPTSHTINISQISNPEISIYNSYGSLINQYTNQKNNTSISIDVSTLIPGIYLLKSANQTTKFIKQ